ncbi:LpqN/LpqT family lipoprotein [Candidatus Mycobacterium methanotrophicum]|uniref:LpqN/LpqT family lipoprotein n=1 Tax=Candidatus Mycobacterium methanotrophicum TaxID=2943498 RepID=A0ABY4QPI0_9MYCO|nr:LpqN/LpqT family lipoprotein [Candidatus Mycobacterium methanotrophicum]UQX12157.1 LpqN/LpqT family lipoprotein [Candidatus Mycobacterium methanotrophicum]
MALALTVLPVGCGPKNPDYQAIWTSTSATSATSTEAPVPFAQYLESSGVTGEAVAPDKLTDLTVSIPIPPGWAKVEKPNVATTTEMIAKGGKIPTAMLTVFKLNGDFDPAEVVRHCNADATLAENFKLLNQSGANFNGFPSSMIEGSYDLKGQRMHTYNRIVIATGPAPARQRYLAQLAVTSLAEQAAPDAADIQSIIHGFTVAAA